MKPTDLKLKDSEITRTKQELQDNINSIKRLKDDLVSHEETMNQLNKVQSQMQQLQRELSNALHEVEQKDLDIKSKKLKKENEK